MDWLQNLLVTIAVFFSLRFLYLRFLKKNKPSDKSCGKDDCGC